MDNNCQIHTGQPKDVLCLSLKCKLKGLICSQCKVESHSQHYSVSVSSLSEILSNNKSVNEVRSKLSASVIEVEKESSKQLNTLVANLLAAQAKFNSEIDALVKLYNFNQDRSLKMLARIQAFLRSLSEFELSEAEKQPTQLIEDITNFLSLAVFETESLDLPQNLENQLNAMLVQSNTIGHFFEKHDLEIQKNCQKMEDSIKQLMWSEVDILQILEVSRYAAENKAKCDLQILCTREKDFPKKFSIIQSKITEFKQIQESVNEYFQFSDSNKKLVEMRLRDPNSFEIVSSIPESNQIIAEISHVDDDNDNNSAIPQLRIIGISGSTRCGKSTLCQQLSIALNADILHQDLFFDKEKIYRELGGNWEKEESVNWKEFEAYMLQEIEKQKREKKGFLIVEGIQLFCQEWIRDLCDVKLFIEVDEMTMYARRMKTTAAPEHYFWEIIAPEYLNYKRKVDAYANSTLSLPKKKQIVYLSGELPIPELCCASLRVIRE